MTHTRPLRDGRATVPPPGRKPLAMRKYHIASLMEDGSVRVSDQIGPAMPAFEAAFSAFSHGTLIATTHGQVAVEDLEPGMKVQTADHGAQEIVWIGSMTLMPRSDDLPDSGNLTRIPADSYGMARPERDLICGPGARLLMRPVGLGARSGLQSDTERALTPAAKLADGMNAIAVYPPRPVTIYHICTRRHAVINAGGLSAETFHPGAGFERHMGPNMLSLFLSFFPHIKAPRDFGPLAHARLPLNDNDPANDVA